MKVDELIMEAKASTLNLIPEKMRKLANKYLTKESSALTVYRIVDSICSKAANVIDEWDSTTIWKTVEKYGIELSEVHKNQVMAIVFLRSQPNIVFHTANEIKNVILPLNNEIPMVTRDEVIDVEHIAWFVEFCNTSLHHLPLFVDYGALEYIAQTLYEEGYFTPPKQLEFARERLNKLNKNVHDYADMVRKEMGKSKSNRDAPNALVAAQMLKLENTQKYVTAMSDALHKSESELT